MKFILITILINLTLTACNENELKNYGVLKVEGIDRFGQNRVCFQNMHEICEESPSLEDMQFATNCEANGNTPHRCSCNEFVCEQKVFKGIDHQGVLKECRPMDLDQMCTMEFTDADQFALDCENDGYEAIQCGCHDYICLNEDQAIAPIEKSTAIEQKGSNQEGIIRSCKTMSDKLNCPAELNRAQIYAQNCRSEGYEVIWCSCDEVLCLDQD